MKITLFLLLILFTLLFTCCEGKITTYKNCTPKCMAWQTCNDNTGLCELSDLRCENNDDCSVLAKPICDLSEHYCVKDTAQECKRNTDCIDKLKPVCNNGICKENSDSKCIEGKTRCSIDNTTVETCTDGINNTWTISSTCDANAKCTGNDNLFSCECNNGYSGDGIICTDIDECATVGNDVNGPCIDDIEVCINNIAAPVTCTRNISFTEDSSINILNPDRGFYDATYILNEEIDYNQFQYAKEDGYNLVYAKINLENYKEIDVLPVELINIIESHLEDAESVSVKLILQIRYRDSTDGEDPPLTRIIKHLNQLKPLLQAHKNIISVIQAGVIGAWGEWHTFTGDFADTNPNYKANRKAVIEKLSEIFPNKYIQIRTPMHKELLFGTSISYEYKGTDAQITPEIAFTSNIKSQIGYHNDCFLANLTDMGTYPSDSIDFWKNYVINDTKYSPIGGETCNMDTGDEAYLTSCENTLAELKKLRYSFLNDSYHPDVLNKWKSEGCYQEIKENLGYKLVANELYMERTSNNIYLSLFIKNEGYAAPYIDSKISFILKNNTNSYKFIQEDINIREFYSEETQKIETNISLSDLNTGEYCLYLQIGEGFSKIRLSNSDIWDIENKMDKLTCNIMVE